MISDKNKCIFIHIPKTGGTSIESVLLGVDEFKTGSDHATISELINRGVDIDQYFKFTIVRNPITRIFSVWNYYVQGGNQGSDLVFKRDIPKNFHAFCETYLIKKNKEFFGMNTLRDQVDFITVYNTLRMDIILSFEMLEKEYKYIKNKLFLGDLPHTRKTKYIQSFHDVSDETKLLISVMYKRDFKILGYG